MSAKWELTETRSCQFYAYSKKFGERTLFSFKVYNENDAHKCLERFRVRAGYYVVRDKATGTVTTNRKIQNKALL